MSPRLHPAPGKVGLTPGSGPRALASLTVVRPSLTLHHSFSPTWLLSERGLTASVLEAPAHAPLPEGPPLRPAGEAARPPSRLSARLGAAWQGVHLFRRSRFTHSESRWVTDSRDSARFVQGCVSRARTRGGLRAGAVPPGEQREPRPRPGAEAVAVGGTPWAAQLPPATFFGSRTYEVHLEEDFTRSRCLELLL